MKDLAQELIRIANKLAAIGTPEDYEKALREQTKDPLIQSLYHQMHPTTKNLNDLLEPPTFVDESGTKHWRQEGLPHRELRPALVKKDGTREWWHNGVCTRREEPNGKTTWLNRGLPHRDNAPAIVYPDGTKEWYQHGRRHRKDGPAVERPDGKNEWWLKGVRQKPPGEKKKWWPFQRSRAAARR